jgi:hypothetical protein
MPTVRKDPSKMAHVLRTMLDTPLVRGVRGGCVEGVGARLDMVLGRRQGVTKQRRKDTFIETLTWPGKGIGFIQSYLAAAHPIKSITPTSKRGTSVQHDISDNRS